MQSYGEKLVAAENAVTEFKRKHQGLMQGAGRDFYGPLSEAKAALRQATLALKECDEDVGGFRRERNTVRLPEQQTGTRVN